MLSVGRHHEIQAARQVAELMCAAARTAPKARGIDNIITAILTEGPEKEEVMAEMRRLGDEAEATFYSRDAANLADADACAIIGTGLQRLEIPGCEFCGYRGCEESEKAGARCAHNAGDLGIAVGSAVSIAADFRMDNRVMLSIGSAVVTLGLLGADVKIAYGIPLSVKGKNIFFDRR